jgi:predicted transposase YbfD/YdcC
LALAVAALLANHLSVLAIAEWGARQSRELLDALGFPDGRPPCQSTFQRLFRKLDGDALAAVLTAHFAPQAAPPTDGLQGVAIDGKAHHGRLQYAPGGGAVHMLSAFCHDQGIALADEPIDSATGQGKAEAELSVAPTLLARIDWRHRVLTGDALHCQRAHCRHVLDDDGDYLLTVKTNQPELHEAIRLLFDPPTEVGAMPLRDRRVVRTLDAGHGRIGDRRELLASTDLSDYLDWPGQAQVFRVTRTWWDQAQRHQAIRYGITSLSPGRADPARAQALHRGHWRIENLLHRTKDVNFGEDASLVHAGAGPTVMALLRDAAVSLLRGHGIRQIAARLRRHGQYPAEAVALVIASPPARA